MYCTELFGTFLIVLFGAGTVCASHLNLEARLNTVGLPIGLDVTGIALAEGLILGALLAAFGPGRTAGFNPAITLALYIRQKFDLTAALLFIVVQLIGAVLAGLVIRLFFSEEILQAASVGTPHLYAFRGDDLGISVEGLTSGALLEVLFTGVLAFFFAWWMLDDRSPRLAGMVVGLVMVAILLLGFRLTGAAANPARWFGPVVWEATLGNPGQAFRDHPVYWAGPIAGALAGALLAGYWLPSPGDRAR
jgi:glycerol uptake facilitator-like aquaporin